MVLSYKASINGRHKFARNYTLHYYLHHSDYMVSTGMLSQTFSGAGGRYKSRITCIFNDNKKEASE